MSSTIESTSMQTFCPDMEQGYKNSPMARLVSQYKASSDNDISTHQRAANFSTKKTLFDSEIIELRGSWKSYSLCLLLLQDITQVVGKLQDVTQVVGELQFFLERTSALIPEQSSYFKVDPKDTFLAILRESSNVGQIHAAWMGLSR